MYNLKKILPARPERSNKGTFGTVFLVAGSEGMAGAAYFASLAAYRSGAGLVKIFTEASNRSILQILIPEAVLITWERTRITEETLDKLGKIMESSTVVAAGPGLGTGEEQERILKYVFHHCRKPVIYDADALNLISRWAGPSYHPNTAITPHLMEMSRLTGLPLPYITEHVPEVAHEYAEVHGITVVLKDHETCVSRGISITSDEKPDCMNHTRGMPVTSDEKPDYVNHTGSSALSKGGSGDVLTGLIAGLAAQGMDLYEACKAGVYIHGLAGEAAGKKYSNYGVLAREIADEIPEILKSAEE